MWILWLQTQRLGRFWTSAIFSLADIKSWILEQKKSFGVFVCLGSGGLGSVSGSILADLQVSSEVQRLHSQQPLPVY